MLMDVFTEDFHPVLDAAVAGLEKRVFHPTAEPRCDGDNIRACTICLNDYEDGVEIAITPCPGRHEFHPRCIVNWLRQSNTCPLCRHAL
ncbi:E3 ubiquitin-protein ligase RLIM [Zea mays]|uniref:E3 ubiquitin-protein ligase RLIM n=1 Tax=Zea mays TaxID=4577 RepID=A0A3L6EVV2_MAIZE|nr:E3 ubiquitin-protein ligase RLIM [Zea mays]